MRASCDNFISRMNLVEQGLNFLVPNNWWKSFFENNQNIKCYREMRLFESYPLDYLFETGVVDHPHPGFHKCFTSILKEADRALKSIKRQLKMAESLPEGESIGKRAKIPCQWLRQQKQLCEQTCDLLLQSPLIRADVAELFEIRSEDWTIVTPQLYRLIWRQQLRDKRQEQQKRMIAIPVLIGSDHDVYINQTIDYGNLRYVELFMKNVSRCGLTFMGYIDGDVSMKNLLKWMKEGMTKLIFAEPQKNHASNDVMVVQMSDKPDVVAYQFYDEQYNQRLKWTEFQQIQNTKIYNSTVARIIMLSGTNFDEEIQCLETKGDVRQLSKKRKRQLLTQRQGNQTAVRAQVRPIVIGEQGSNFHRVQGQIQIQIHSSTQEETPSELEQREVIIIQNAQSSPKNSRIPFPLWKERLSQENLIKFAQLRLTIPKIFKPFSDQATIVVKDEGKKAVLPKECNQLLKTQQGEFVQQQISERGAEQDVPSQSVKKQLQLLARDILGMKIVEVSEQAQKVQVDLVKESSYCEDKTCKNEYMDEFDCEESNFE